MNVVEQLPLSGTDNIVESYEPEHFTIGDDGRKIGFSNPDGVYLLERDGLALRISQLSETGAIASLEFDSFGALWVFPTDAASPIEVFDARGAARSIPIELEGIRIWGSLSPEGGRLAQAIQNPAGESVLSVETISRDSAMIPLRTSAGLAVRPVVGTPISLTWHGSNAIRVLEQTASGLSALSEYPLTGPRRPLTMPPVVGTQLLSGPSSISTYLLSETGELWTLSGNTWRQGAKGVIALAALR